MKKRQQLHLSVSEELMSDLVKHSRRLRQKNPQQLLLRLAEAFCQWLKHRQLPPTSWSGPVPTVREEVEEMFRELSEA